MSTQNGFQVAVINIDDVLPPTKFDGFVEKTANELVASARQAFNSGKTKSIPFRKEQLKNLRRLVLENASEIQDAIKCDIGRHKAETDMFELTPTLDEITNLIWNLEDWVRPEYPQKPLTNFLDTLYICNEPYGVVLVIGAWNFPAMLLLVPVAGAIAAGNCVLMKPSEITSATEKLMAKLVPLYLDKECYYVITGGPKETSAILEERLDYIFFTGSANVGRIIHAAANKYLTPVTLELGGKNPLYIDDTVDMLKAARRVLFGKCGNAGQICIAPDYMLCSEQVQEAFVEAARKVMEEWYQSEPKSSPNYCRIVTDNHWNRLVSLIQNKNNVAMGGRHDRSDRYIEPTILTNVTLDDPIMKQEIFGPILPIVPVKHIQDAVKIINGYEKPLCLYIFTNNTNTKKLLLHSCTSGGVLVNDTLTHFIVNTLPFGGVGMSGMGHYHGKGTFDTFVHKRSVLEKGYMGVVEYAMRFRLPPYSDLKSKILNEMVKIRDLPSLWTVYTIVTFIFGILFVIIIQALFK